MDVKLTAEGAIKYKDAINCYRLSDDQLAGLESTGKAYRLTRELLAEMLGKPTWYPKRITRFLNREIYLRDHEAEHFCKTLKIHFDLSEYEIKPGTAPPPPSASANLGLSEKIEPLSPAPDTDSKRSLNLPATILAVAFLKALPMHYEIRAYEWRGSSFVELAESLCRELKTIQLDAATQEWGRIAQAIVSWVEKAKAAKRGNAKYLLVELLLPWRLLLKMIEANFLEQLCDLPYEDEVIECRFVACCPVVVRPLDRYVRQDWQRKSDVLFDKYQQLLEGKGMWVHDKVAAHVDGAFNKRDNESYAALQLVDDLPADSSEEWLRKLIISNIPLALWWNAAGAHDPEARKEHFRQYKKDDIALLDILGDAEKRWQSVVQRIWKHCPAFVWSSPLTPSPPRWCCSATIPVGCPISPAVPIRAPFLPVPSADPYDHSSSRARLGSLHQHSRRRAQPGQGSFHAAATAVAQI